MEEEEEEGADLWAVEEESRWVNCERIETKTVEGFCFAVELPRPCLHGGTFFIGGGRHGKQRLAFFSCPRSAPRSCSWTDGRGERRTSPEKRVIPDRPGNKPLTHRASKGPSCRPAAFALTSGWPGRRAAGAGVPETGRTMGAGAGWAERRGGHGSRRVPACRLARSRRGRRVRGGSL